MQLTLERPGHAYVLRGADGRCALVNDRRLTASFHVSADALVDTWPVSDIAQLTPELLRPLLDQQPELVLLGCGERQAFAPAETQAACLRAGVGFEVMTNAAAARTFNLLADEGRRVVAGFIISPAA